MNEVMVVSGLPRSGTSLMMRILAAAGLPLLVDGIRQPDIDNPHGYFEYERVKTLPQDQSWVEEACGKVVKVIFRLVPQLPSRLTYRIVFMERDLGEVLQSQEKMVRRLGGQPLGRREREQLEHAYRRELAAIKSWIGRQPNMKMLSLEHRRLLTDPTAPLKELTRFLSLPADVDPERLRAAIDNRLHRNRAATPGAHETAGPA